MKTWRTLLALFLIGACAGDPTETIVLIDLDEALRERAATIEVAVFGDDDGMVLLQEVALADLTLPARVPLAPIGGDVTRSWRIEVTAKTDYGCTIGMGVLAGGYEAQTHLELPLLIASTPDACPEVFVDNTGRNDNNCLDVTTPCQNIGAGFDYVADGRARVITLAAGQSFRESWFRLGDDELGSDPAPIVIRGRSDGGRPIVYTNVEYGLSLSRDVTFQHIAFVGTPGSGGEDSISIGAAHVTFIDCSFEEFEGSAISTGSPTIGLTVQGSEFRNNGTAIGIQWRASEGVDDIVLSDNVFVDNSVGIRTRGYRTHILRNQICGNSSAGISLDGVDDTEVMNNSVVGNNIGISSTQSADIRYNLIANNTMAALDYSEGRRQTVFNIFWPDMPVLGGGMLSLTDVVVDPQLINSECGSIDVGPDSPARPTEERPEIIGVFAPPN